MSDCIVVHLRTLALCLVDLRHVQHHSFAVRRWNCSHCDVKSKFFRSVYFNFNDRGAHRDRGDQVFWHSLQRRIVVIVFDTCPFQMSSSQSSVNFQTTSVGLTTRVYILVACWIRETCSRNFPLCIINCETVASQLGCQFHKLLFVTLQDIDLVGLAPRQRLHWLDWTQRDCGWTHEIWL